MAKASVEAETVHDLTRWRCLADLALRGLHQTYHTGQTTLPYTRRWDGHRAGGQGRSIRYALMSLLGLTKAPLIIGPQDQLVASLWQRIACACDSTELSAGDLGLGLWARALHGSEAEDFTAAQALRAYHNQANACDSAELAWLLLGADHALLNGPGSKQAEQLADETKRALIDLFNPDTKLFYRHVRQGLPHRISRRLACFANQIYPVMALAIHTRRTGCREAATIAGSVADNLCRLQGKLGQWWWLYDVRWGQVAEEYPVFSVHQDAMAPMALLEVTLALGRCYATPIERGLQWLFGANELSQAMVLHRPGLILRDIHVRGFGRVRRVIQGTLWCCGWRRKRSKATRPIRFVVNAECRPYHLGWVLYAASLVAQIANPAQNRWEQRRINYGT